MFPSAFDYVAARSVDEAVAAKAEGGDETRFLAGGQSLHPDDEDAPRDAGEARRHQRHRRPRHPRTRQRSPARRRARPARRSRAAPTSRSGRSRRPPPWISDPLVRNRGTLCGSVAHCDPEGDWNSVLLATGADVVARGRNGERIVPIADFVVDFFTNALADDEMVTEVRIPVPTGRAGGSYQKLERKVGDYATVAVAAHLELGDDGTIARAGVALTAVAPDEHEGRRRGGRCSSASSRATSCSPRRASSPRRHPSRATTYAARPNGSATSCASFTRRALAAAAAQAQGGELERRGDHGHGQRNGAHARRRAAHAARRLRPHERRAHRHAHRLRHDQLRRVHACWSTARR